MEQWAVKYSSNIIWYGLLNAKAQHLFLFLGNWNYGASDRALLFSTQVGRHRKISGCILPSILVSELSGPQNCQKLQCRKATILRSFLWSKALICLSILLYGIWTSLGMRTCQHSTDPLIEIRPLSQHLFFGNEPPIRMGIVTSIPINRTYAC